MDSVSILGALALLALYHMLFVGRSSHTSRWTSRRFAPFLDEICVRERLKEKEFK
jgi:hypothetical protein